MTRLPVAGREGGKLMLAALAGVLALLLIAGDASAHTRLNTATATPDALTLEFASEARAKLTRVQVVTVDGTDVRPAALRGVEGATNAVRLPFRAPLTAGRYFFRWATANDDGHVVDGAAEFTVTPAAAAAAGAKAPRAAASPAAKTSPSTPASPDSGATRTPPATPASPAPGATRSLPATPASPDPPASRTPPATPASPAPTTPSLPVTPLGSSSAQAAAVREAMPAAPGGLTAGFAVVRGLQDAAVVIAIGITAFLLAVWRAGSLPVVRERLRRIVLGAAVVGAVTAALALVLHGLVLAYSLADEVTIGNGLSMSLGTQAGRAWVAIAFGWLVLFLIARTRPGTPVVLALAAGIAVFSALRGHDPGPTIVTHVLAVSVWFGGLLALLVCAREGRMYAKQLSDVIGRFGRLALPCAAAVLGTGVLQAVGGLGAIDQFVSTGYGRLIVLKAALFVLVIGIAAYNRGRVRRRLLSEDPTRMTVVLRRAVGAEVALASVAVAAGAVLAGTAPPV